MSARTLVVPDHPALIEGFHGWRMVVVVDRVEAVVSAAQRVERQNSLVAVVLHLEQPLTAVVAPEAWRDLPLAVHLPAMGRFRELFAKIDDLRRLNARWFFPVGAAGSLTACRILSSLGIASGLTFSATEPDWEGLVDLLTFSIYGRSPHVPIEPFDYLIERYDPNLRLNWQGVWFDDPARFLHLTVDGRVALTAGDLRAERFLDCDLGALAEIDTLPTTQERLEAWRHFFLDAGTCACCPAWRVCLGRFDGLCRDPEQGCRRFFLELMACAEQRATERQGRKTLWQP